MSKDEEKTIEYVRTYDGIIGIVKYKEANNTVIIVNDEEIELSSGIYKTSFDIIDLIEVRRFSKWLLRSYCKNS